MKLLNLLTAALAFPAWLWPLGNKFKQVGETVKSIKIHQEVSLPFTKQEMESWKSLVSDTILLHKMQKWLLPSIHTEMHNLDNHNVQRLLGYLADYVKERRDPNLGGQVYEATDEQARSALRELIAIQQQRNWILPHNKWKMPKIAKDRLPAIINPGSG